VAPSVPDRARHALPGDLGQPHSAALEPSRNLPRRLSGGRVCRVDYFDCGCDRGPERVSIPDVSILPQKQRHRIALKHHSARPLCVNPHRADGGSMDLPIGDLLV
jgi:hypothetical protein